MEGSQRTEGCRRNVNRAPEQPGAQIRLGGFDVA